MTGQERQDRTIIVGTAGHIDHGKSALVAALTGTDPDRLPEEKARGITIDLGFAHLDDGDGLVFSFVDVPGHERFVKNMLAGVGGVDLVLLVVAADESVMPQTREHFHICRLLGAKRGVVAVTKQDLVDQEIVSLVRMEVEDLVEGSFLEGAPVVAISSRTKEGLDDLLDALRRTSAGLEPRRMEGPFRLPVDRVFTIQGFGTVVTGTAVSGRVRTGDSLEVLPSGRKVRVRGIQVHGGEREEAAAGQRVALNLQGTARGEIARGDWMAEPERYRRASMLDARIEVLSDAPVPLEDLDRMRFHAGSAEILARIRVLEPGGRVPPGGRGLVQVRLERPVHAVAGDRFVLRRYSPVTTLAGGMVLDPSPPKRSRSDPALESHARALASTDPRVVLGEWVRAAGESGISLTEAAARTDWPRHVLEDAAAGLVEGGEAVRAGPVLMDHGAWSALADRALSVLEAHHEAHPLSPGLGIPELRAALRMEDEPFRALLEAGTREGRLRREGERAAASAHRIVLSAEERDLRDALEAAFREGRLTPPEEKDVLRSHSGPRTREIYQLLHEEGLLVRLKGGYVFHRDVLRDLEEDVRRGPDSFSVPGFKDRTGTTRKHAIPLLEYLDGRNVTCRTGDLRRVVPPSPARSSSG